MYHATHVNHDSNDDQIQMNHIGNLEKLLFPVPYNGIILFIICVTVSK